MSNPLSPPPTASTHDPSSYHAITQKSHRLRTSPVPGEGSTFVPVVKFNQSFTQRNALRGVKPVYGNTSVELIQPPQPDVVSIPRPPGGRGVDARTAGWTISITTSSSAPTSNNNDDDLQVEIQQHFEPARPRSPLQQQQHQPGGGLSGSAVGVPNIPPLVQPPIPTLAHDRVILKEEDFSRIRTKSFLTILLGCLFPPIWVLMGWGHALDGFLLPAVGTTVIQKQRIMEVYRPFRIVAAGLAGVAAVGSFVGMIVGGLALGGVIV